MDGKTLLATFRWANIRTYVIGSWIVEIVISSWIGSRNVLEVTC